MRIPPLDEEAMRKARERQERLTKPKGSLGFLEEISVLIAGMTANERPRIEKKLVLTLAADHGVAEEGVSAYPREVTAQMVRNFLRGGAAINDLEVLAKSGMLDDSGIKLLDYRDKDESIKKHLLKIFKSSNPMDALQDNDFDIDTKILWLDENLPLEYSNRALFEAYEIMSFADILRARIRRRQHWRFLVAINTLLTFGISSVKQWAGSSSKVKNKFKKIVDYKPPSRILKMWIYKNKLMRKKSIAEKLALKQHSSLEEAEQNVIFLKVMIRNKDYKDKIVEELGLTKEEVEWLEK